MTKVQVDIIISMNGKEDFSKLYWNTIVAIINSDSFEAIFKLEDKFGIRFF